MSSSEAELKRTIRVLITWIELLAAQVGANVEGTVVEIVLDGNGKPRPIRQHLLSKSIRRARAICGPEEGGSNLFSLEAAIWAAAEVQRLEHLARLAETPHSQIIERLQESPEREQLMLLLQLRLNAELEILDVEGRV